MGWHSLSQSSQYYSWSTATTFFTPRLSTKDRSNTLAQTESKSGKSSDEEDVVSVFEVPTPEDFEDGDVESGTKQDEENLDSFIVSNVCTLLSCQYYRLIQLTNV